MVSLILIWSFALFLIIGIIKKRTTIWRLYNSFIIWWLVRKTKKKLIALGKKDMADAIRWDEKWY